MRVRQRDERGNATIEVIGILPLAILVAGVIVQLFLIGYSAVVAESAARMAAREASQGMFFPTATDRAHRNVPDLFDAQIEISHGDVSQGGHEPGVTAATRQHERVSAEATVEVPFLGIGVPGLDLEVRRYAVVPVIR